MKKSIKTILIIAIALKVSMQIPLSSLAQNGYPKLRIENGDSVGVYHISQVRKINSLYFENQMHLEQLSNLQQQNDSLFAKTNTQGQIIQSLQYENSLQNQIHDQNTKLIANQQTSIDKKTKWLTVFKTTTTGLLITAIIAIAI